MSETAEKKTGRRSEPGRKKHRIALELTMTKTKTEQLIQQAVRRYSRLKEEEKAWREWVNEKVIQGILEKSNAQLDPDQQTDTLTLYSADTEYKFTVERQLKKFVDARAEMAKAQIEDWLREYESKTIQADQDSALIYEFLKKMFFGAQMKQFRWTPQLLEFIMLDPAKIHDRRLKEAQKLLKESLRIDRTNWYSHVYKYDDESNDYKKLEA